MPDTYVNVARSSVAANTPALGSTRGWAAADTACKLAANEGTRFSPSGTYYVEMGDDHSAVKEYAKCTARSGDTLTLVRGVGAIDWPVGTPVRQLSSKPSTTDARGDTTAPGAVTVAVPLTTVATAPQPYNAMVYFLTAGTTTVIKIDATTVGSVAAVGTALYVPAGSTVTLTYSGAPTWQWMAVP